MEQAVAALAARRDALAEHEAGAFERQDLGFAPRRVMEVDARCRLAGRHLGAEVDQRFEQAAVRGIDIIVVATDLGQPRRGRRWHGALQQAIWASTRRVPSCVILSYCGVTSP